METVVVIPTYNEALNIEKLLGEIFEKYPDLSVLVVDDNSTDGTRDIVERLCQSTNKLHILKRASKMGLASAYIDGFKRAIELGFEKFIEMDADFSHDPKYLLNMTETLKTNDVAIGSRNIKGGSVVGWGFLRNFISKGGSLYSKLILSCPINDLTGGFNGWTKEALEAINLDNIISKGYSFQIEMKYKAFKKGLKIKEFPIQFIDRKYGESKMSKHIFVEALLNVIKIRLKG